jgi:hypothetical protein
MSVIIVNTNPNNGGFASNGAPVACGAPMGACGGNDMYEKKKKHPVLKFLLAAGIIGGGGLFVWKRGGERMFYTQIAKKVEKFCGRLQQKDLNATFEKLYQHFPGWMLSPQKGEKFFKNLKQHISPEHEGIIQTAQKYYEKACQSKAARKTAENIVQNEH